MLQYVGINVNDPGAGGTGFTVDSRPQRRRAWRTFGWTGRRSRGPTTSEQSAAVAE